MAGDEKEEPKEVLHLLVIEGDEKEAVLKEALHPPIKEGDEKEALKEALHLPIKKGDEKEALKEALHLPIKEGDEKEALKEALHLPIMEGDEKEALKEVLHLSIIEGDEKEELKESLHLPIMEGDEKEERKEVFHHSIMEGDEQEALRLIEEIHITIKEVQDSEFYSEALNQLHNNQSIRTHISRVMGPNSRLKMVIYGLGSIEYSFKSQFQLSLAILLRRDFDNWIDEMEVYDPLMTRADSIAMEAFGCRVLSKNENCMRKVEEPTLFFTPYLFCDDIGRIFKANWCPARLNRMILLGNSLGRIAEWGDFFKGEEVWRITSMQTYTEEFEIDEDNCPTPFYRFGWHFFNVCPDVDMEALVRRVPSRRLPEEDKHEEDFEYETEAKYIERITAEPFIKNDTPKDWMYEHRRPRRFRQRWWPPHPGWIKLNFSGTDPTKSRPSGFGGIFHNEHGNILLSYAGPLKDYDPITVGIEALRVGMRCVKLLSTVSKLIIEGDSLSIIRWANETVDPPERFDEAFDEINDLTEDVECVIVHVYREANSMARKLACRGANLTELCIWE